MHRILFTLLASLTAVFSEPARAAEANIFARSNLVAWCIVPFDAKKRGPEERAQMLERLGIKRFAYDWRAEHIPSLRRRDRGLPAPRRRNHRVVVSHDARQRREDDSVRVGAAQNQNAIMGDGRRRAGRKTNPSSAKRVQTEQRAFARLRKAAARIGCTVALYNHGNWFGEPENQIAIIRALGMTNVGIVYNFHHGHDHIARFPELFRKMQPHLFAVNLSGMVVDGEKRGQKILHLSEGDQELAMMKVIRDSGWRGPVGIIDHREQTDSEETLRNNLRGLEWLAKELEKPGSGGVKPFKQ
jgi:sugar phosphate isomerase/epimerase